LVVTSSGAQKITLTVDAGRQVSALLNAPPRSFACDVLTHGAGAGMTHPSMEVRGEILDALAAWARKVVAGLIADCALAGAYCPTAVVVRQWSAIGGTKRTSYR
jgi:hypothetical protein